MIHFSTDSTMCYNDIYSLIHCIICICNVHDDITYVMTASVSALQCQCWVLQMCYKAYLCNPMTKQCWWQILHCPIDAADEALEKHR